MISKGRGSVARRVHELNNGVTLVIGSIGGALNVVARVHKEISADGLPVARYRGVA